MTDQSHLDDRYLIDEHVFNCPFCNRRHVAYTVIGKQRFDWTENKACHVYLTRCASCSNTAMHLSFEDLAIKPLYQDGRGTPHYRFNMGEGSTDSTPPSSTLSQPRSSCWTPEFLKCCVS